MPARPFNPFGGLTVFSYPNGIRSLAPAVYTPFRSQIKKTVYNGLIK